MLVCAPVELVIMVPMGLFVWTMVVIGVVCWIVVTDVFEHPFNNNKADRTMEQIILFNYLFLNRVTL